MHSILLLCNLPDMTVHNQVRGRLRLYQLWSKQQKLDFILPFCLVPLCARPSMPDFIMHQPTGEFKVQTVPGQEQAAAGPALLAAFQTEVFRVEVEGGAALLLQWVADVQVSVKEVLLAGAVGWSALEVQLEMLLAEDGRRIALWLRQPADIPIRVKGVRVEAEVSRRVLLAVDARALQENSELRVRVGRLSR